MAKLLITDDDESLVSIIAKALVNEGYQVETCYRKRDAEDLLAVSKFDILILDVDLPDGSGFDLLRDFRASGGNTPIIMLTGKSEISDKEEGLDLGADDYLTKPFSLRELSARLRAILRRPENLLSKQIDIGGAIVDLSNKTLLVAGKAVHLQPLDFALLEYLVKHPNQVLPAERLLNAVWDSFSESGSEALRASIKRIRREIDGPDDKSHIETLYKQGYIFHLGKPTPKEEQ